MVRDEGFAHCRFNDDRCIFHGIWIDEAIWNEDTRRFTCAVIETRTNA